MAENVSNMFTKNVSSDIHEKHKGEYIWTKEDLDSLLWKLFFNAHFHNRKGVGRYCSWTSKRTENRQLYEQDYTSDKYKTLGIC